jgi:hypothetical protein
LIVLAVICSKLRQCAARDWTLPAARLACVPLASPGIRKRKKRSKAGQIAARKDKVISSGMARFGGHSKDRDHDSPVFVNVFVSDRDFCVGACANES